MKIKHRLHVGFGVLFLLVIFLGVFSLFYFTRLANDTESTLKNNYASLQTTAKIREILDRSALPLTSEVRQTLVDILGAEKLITEPATARVADSLKGDILLLAAGKNHEEQQRTLVDAHRKLNFIDQASLRSTVQKNVAAEGSVKQAMRFLAIIGSLTFFILFTYIVNFSAFITKPVNELREALDQIDRGNLQVQLDLPEEGEFATITNAFNRLMRRLRGWQERDLMEAAAYRARMEAVIRDIAEPVLVVDEKKSVIFINAAAEKTLEIYTDKRNKSLQTFSVDYSGNELFNELLLNKNPEGHIRIFQGKQELDFLYKRIEIGIPVYHSNDNDLPVEVGSRPAGQVLILAQMGSVSKSA